MGWLGLRAHACVGVCVCVFVCVALCACDVGVEGERAREAQGANWERNAGNLRKQRRKRGARGQERLKSRTLKKQENNSVAHTDAHTHVHTHTQAHTHTRTDAHAHTRTFSPAALTSLKCATVGGLYEADMIPTLYGFPLSPPLPTDHPAAARCVGRMRA